MAWLLSSGLQQEILAGQPGSPVYKIGSDISFGNGDGTGGRDTINQVAAELDVFGVHDYILIVGSTLNGTMVKALAVAAGTIEVAANSFGAGVIAGTATCLVKITSGSIAKIMQNGVLEGRTGLRPLTADLAESGTLAITLTLNGGTFVAGQSANGINMGALSGNSMGRAVDPNTGMPEVIRGAALITGDIGYYVWYDNAKVQGASSSAKRMYGLASPSGADVNLTTGTSVVTGVYSEVTSINATIVGV